MGVWQFVENIGDGYENGFCFTLVKVEKVIVHAEDGTDTLDHVGVCLGVRGLSVNVNLSISIAMKFKAMLVENAEVGRCR